MEDGGVAYFSNNCDKRRSHNHIYIALIVCLHILLNIHHNTTHEQECCSLREGVFQYNIFRKHQNRSLHCKHNLMFLLLSSLLYDINHTSNPFENIGG